MTYCVVATEPDELYMEVPNTLLYLYLEINNMPQISVCMHTAALQAFGLLSIGMICCA